MASRDPRHRPIWGYVCMRLNATSTQRPILNGGARSPRRPRRPRAIGCGYAAASPRSFHRAVRDLPCYATDISLRLRVCTDILDSGPLTPATLNACARALSVGVHRLFDAHIDRRPPPCAVAGLSLTSCHTTVRRSAAHASTASSSRTRSDAPLRSYALAVSATRGKPLPRHPERRTRMRPGRFIHVCVLSPAPLLTKLLTHSSCASLACPYPSLVII